MIGVAEAALAGILTGAWLGAAWWLWQRRCGAVAVVPMALAAGLVAMVAVVLAAPPIWHAAARGYPGDSLFTLRPAAIAGVVALSFGLIALFFLVVTWKSVGWRSGRRPAASSPQGSTCWPVWPCSACFTPCRVRPTTRSTARSFRTCQING